jgi:hypothetical protein
MRIKRLLALSTLLNLVLIGSTGYLFVRRTDVRPVPITLGPSPGANTDAPNPRHEASAEPAAAAFHWSQVESDDYPTYISNLRAIGCPEQTISLIVTGELNAVYAEKRQQLEAQRSQESPGQASSLDIPKLQQEESDVIASLLGPKPASGMVPGSGTVSAQSVSASQDAAQAVTSVSVPLAFQIDPNLLRANGVQQLPSSNGNSRPVSGPVEPNDSQTAAIDQVRQSFVSDLGGENQNPHDPGYLRRWKRAQPSADELLMALLGTELFERYQIQAAQQAYAASTAK